MINGSFFAVYKTLIMLFAVLAWWP